MSTTHPGRATAVRLVTLAGEDGARREIAVLPGAGGSRLVVDRPVEDRDDDAGVDDTSAPRLLAHLSSDEPFINAEIVCDMYLADKSRNCRPVTPSDFRRPPLHGASATGDGAGVLTSANGTRFRLAAVGPARELRWVCESDGRRGKCVSIRDVVAALEDYEAARSATVAAIASHRRARDVSVATLGAELRRLGASPIILNRGLREAVLAAIGRGVSMSAIALACGRIKRDRRGRASGETSWLGRRVGLLADSDKSAPNPWVHSDVLGLIARDGLGVAPHEVELA